MQAGQPDRLLGYPLYTSPYVPVAVASALLVAFGDFANFWIANCMGRTAQRLIELYAGNGQIGFIATQRVDAKVILDFVTKGDQVIASVRAYRETRNTTARWERIIGSAAFSNVAALFRLRKIPGVDVMTSHFIVDGEGRYNIVSVEDVRGRGMYIEVLAERLEGTVK